MPETPVRPFAHLHCHSHYSLLDGASSINRLVERAVDHGMNALAITDHGNLHGALDFYRTAKAAGINPILGYEAYVAPGSRHEKANAARGDTSYHLTLLCQNRIGVQNLIKMASAASLEGFYFKPRVDKELLEQYSEGIICLSGCVSGELSRSILRGGAGVEDQLSEAAEVAQWFHGIFGDRYYIEIMNNGVELQNIALQGSVDLANRLGIPLVATSDCHYVDPDDAEAQDIMLCINTGKFRTDANRMKMDGQQYYLRTAGEMYEKFPGLEGAVARSQEIADSVEIELDLGKRHFPRFHVPTEESGEEFLRRLCIQGLNERYADDEQMRPGGQLSDAVLRRLDHELSAINKLGFANYFLIVWDFVDYARRNEIPATARGSGVGALVCYALYLSHVCPIQYDLLFERFLDENRQEAPDIDIDFCKDRRGEIIRYVKDKYGEDNVAQIGTFGTMAARAAIKDVGRALGLPLARVNQITAMIPEQLGITIEGALEKSDELSELYRNDSETRELIDFARKLEGLARNVGTHAAAVVIGDRPLTEYVPLGRVSGKDDVITQWSMGDVEAAGLLKMDFLGLRNLTILSKAVEIIGQTTGKKLDLLRLPLEDRETFELLQRGETRGIFQLESGGIRDLLQKMKPDHFNDIIATLALYRPGPLEGGMVQQYVDIKNGRREAAYKHPVLEQVLSETHGIMVYQEQVMRILNRLGKIPLAAAYTCIKAISKKKESLIAQNHDQFIEGAQESGLSHKVAQEFWDMILKFAGYGFNKSHSTAYALIAYQTAYLKAHFPVEFMAALLTGDIPGRNFTRKDSLVEHLEDCERMGIDVLPPDVNRSSADFTVDEGKINFAFSAIKGCGGSAAESIVAAREDGGPFRDLFDFCERVSASECNRSSIESLNKAGAFDSFGAERSQLAETLDRALQSGASAAADRRSGQMNLFGGDDESESESRHDAAVMPDVPPWDEREQLIAEKEVLGFYLSSHPLEHFTGKLHQFCSHSTNNVAALKDRDTVAMGGMISSIKQSHIRRVREPNSPTRYVMFDLEDVDGTIRCIMWPSEFIEYGDLIQPDAVLVVYGTIDRRGGDEANLVVNKALALDELDEHMADTVRIVMTEDRHSPALLNQVYEIIRGYPGQRKLEISWHLSDGTTVRLQSQSTKVDLNDEMRSRLNEILGDGTVMYVTSQTSLAKSAHQESNGRNGNQRRVFA